MAGASSHSDLFLVFICWNRVVMLWSWQRDKRFLQIYYPLIWLDHRGLSAPYFCLILNKMWKHAARGAGWNTLYTMCGGVQMCTAEAGSQVLGRRAVQDPAAADAGLWHLAVDLRHANGFCRNIWQTIVQLPATYTSSALLCDNTRARAAGRLDTQGHRNMKRNQG